MEEKSIVVLAKKKRPSAIRRVLVRGADPNETDGASRAALHWAAQEGLTEIVRCLLEFGGNPNSIDKLGFTPLAVAAGENRPTIIRCLLRAGANPNHRIPGDQNGTALHLACSWGNTGAVRALLECSNTNVDARDADGKTPLSYAIESRNAKLIKYLKRHKAIKKGFPGSKNKSGQGMLGKHQRKSRIV